MMKAIDYFKTKNRMTKGCTIDCDSCLLSSSANPKEEMCTEFEIEYPQEAIKIVQDWLERNPNKTRKERLLEFFPDAPIGDYGTPSICCKALGITKECFFNDGSVDCIGCWNEPYYE